MEIFPWLQAKLLLLTFLTGLCTGALFDLFSQVTGVLKKRFLRISLTVRAIGDLVTVTLAGVTVIILCYYFNKGEFRFFCILGLVAGLLLYFFAFSFIVKRIYKCIFCVIFGVFRFFWRPMFRFAKFIERNLQIILYYASKALAKKAILVYNICIKRSTLKKARRGFLRGRFK